MHTTAPEEETDSGKAFQPGDEQRLLDKMADFEGKVEALDFLKENLYTAIAQVDSDNSEI